MIVQEVIDIFKAETNYVGKSMINKSFNDEGCTFKWLAKNGISALRREVFISTVVDPEVDLLNRTVIEYVEIGDAQ